MIKISFSSIDIQKNLKSQNTLILSFSGHINRIPLAVFLLEEKGTLY